MLEELKPDRRTVELEINMDKSEVMENEHGESGLFSKCNETLEQVEDTSIRLLPVPIPTVRRKSGAQ